MYIITFIILVVYFPFLLFFFDNDYRVVEILKVFANYRILLQKMESSYTIEINNHSMYTFNNIIEKYGSLVKSTARKMENANKKLIHAVLSIHFLKLCKAKELIPNFLK